MTTDQEADDLAASVRHRMEQRGRAAREWERQAKQWEERWRAVTGERDAALGKAAELEAWRDQPERARKITQLIETIVRLEQERDAAQTKIEKLDRQNDELIAEHEMMRHEASEARISAQAANNAMYHAIRREREAQAELKRLRAALDGLYGAVLNDMTARDLSHEWAPDSAMARASTALTGAAGEGEK